MILFGEEAQPANPPAGKVLIYGDAADHNIYAVNSNGTKVALSDVTAATQMLAFVNLILAGI
jgi:hypothetical protein